MSHNLAVIVAHRSPSQPRRDSYAHPPALTLAIYYGRNACFPSLAPSYVGEQEPKASIKISEEPGWEVANCRWVRYLEDDKLDTGRLLMAAGRSINRFATLQQLRELGYEVEALETGPRALETLAYQNNDVVRLELQTDPTVGHSVLLSLNFQAVPNALAIIITCSSSNYLAAAAMRADGLKQQEEIARLKHKLEEL